HWQASDYQAEGLNGHGPGNLAAWCGEDFPSCGATDEPGGYGDSYRDFLVWSAPVASPDQPCTVTIGCRLNYDVEPGYDYVRVAVALASEAVHVLAEFDGKAADVPLDLNFTYLPGDYVGPGADEIVVMFLVWSDGGWSDEDCSWPTVGACQIDDVGVSLSNGGTAIFDDFQDGTLGNWNVELTTGVGDFAQLWSGLDDLDPCASNSSPQVAFIDDGLVVPWVGPSECITWCYGPSGYVVNTTGGRLGGWYDDLNNGVESPVMAWPGPQYTGALVDYTFYQHMPDLFGQSAVWSTWAVRSTASADPADIEDAPWELNPYYYGGPEYRRVSHDVTALLEPGLRYFQVQIKAKQFTWNWSLGWAVFDATPAPYFDNVRVTAFEHGGPYMSASEISLAQDNFPAGGVIDESTLGNNSVRFDMAYNIAAYSQMINQPGDSLVVAIRAARVGASVEWPRMHYILKPNPMFDPYRSSGLPASGVVDGYLVGEGGDPLAGGYAFDLPDTGFMFPGDVIHYFFSAQENLLGDLRTSLLPADTTGFADFTDFMSYDPVFTMRALPTMRNPGGSLDYADHLLWYDGDLGGLDKWWLAILNSSLDYNSSVDVYRTQQASYGAGNGLGGRATSAQLNHYDTILYDSGIYSANTLGVGSGYDPSRDVQVLDEWLAHGGHNLLLTGNGLMGDLTISADGVAFNDQWIGVTVHPTSLQDLIHNQDSPVAQPIPGNGVFDSADSWLVYGSCPSPAFFSAVEAAPGTERLAEYLDPGRNDGSYPYAAATRRIEPTVSSQVVLLPYSLATIWTDPGAAKAMPGMPVRSVVLIDILEAFGNYSPGFPADVPAAGTFTAEAWPNPFNPKVKISYTLPVAGEVTVRVYDVKGRLVRELKDEPAPAGA
ncbi:T9SS type A sorting domain-containing protein, partial [bacterium]|nr:T9SS type A sorting domain-containing protein [bacterium]